MGCLRSQYEAARLQSSPPRVVPRGNTWTFMDTHLVLRAPITEDSAQEQPGRCGPQPRRGPCGGERLAATPRAAALRRAFRLALA